MKRNWLIYALACSVGLNIGAIASYAFWRFGSPPAMSVERQASSLSFREFWQSLDLRQE